MRLFRAMLAKSGQVFLWQQPHSGGKSMTGSPRGNCTCVLHEFDKSRPGRAAASGPIVQFWPSFRPAGAGLNRDKMTVKVLFAYTCTWSS